MATRAKPDAFCLSRLRDSLLGHDPKALRTRLCDLALGASATPHGPHLHPSGQTKKSARVKTRRAKMTSGVSGYHGVDWLTGSYPPRRWACGPAGAPASDVARFINQFGRPEARLSCRHPCLVIQAEIDGPQCERQVGRASEAFTRLSPPHSIGVSIGKRSNASLLGGRSL
jgi:hypothetical protein